VPGGKYKILLDFVNSQGYRTNIQGYLSFLDPDGGGRGKALEFNEIDTAARKSAGFELKKPQVLLIRVSNTTYSVNYAVRIRPDEG
jgi:hypothetical protein